MAEESFTDNLLRAVVAQLHLLNGMTASREMFGKGYFSLGLSEKIAVDQAVLGMVAANYQSLTAESLAAQKAPQSMGFGVPTSSPKAEKT
jgi:hypothetical protein